MTASDPDSSSGSSSSSSSSESSPGTDSAGPGSTEPEHPLQVAIQNDQYDEAKTLLESGEDLLETSLKYKLEENESIEILSVTPLSLAAALGKTSIAQLFLEHDANVKSEDPKFGETALHLASRNGHGEIVNLLLPKNVDLDKKGRNGLRPTHLAARYGRTDILASLLDVKEDLGQRDDEGNTPFLMACLYGQLDVLKLLWERGSKDQIKDTNIYSNGPLHLAAINDRRDTVKWLIGLGLTVDQPGNTGRTPLLLACESGHSEVIDMLLDNGADLHKGQGPMLNSPILWASFHVQVASLKTLLRHGALVSSMDKQENNCFHKVVICSGEFSDAHEGVLDTLIGAGVDINKPNNFGYSPLYLACAENKDKHIEYFMTLPGVDLNQRMPNGATALMEACCNPNTEIVNMLLERGGDMTTGNNHGVAALGLACIFNRLENVKTLINHGAKVDVRDKEGHTPLYTALTKHNIEIVLEILTTPQYYPKYPAVEKAFTECAAGMVDVVKMEDIWLKKLEEREFEESQQLPTILHWAISNRALKLAQRCISHNPKVLQWKRNGATWLHIVAQYGQTQLLQPSTDTPGEAAPGEAAERTPFHEIDVLARAEGNITALHVAVVNGDIEIAKLLLQMLPTQLQKVAAIMDRNSQGESPLTISISRRSKSLEKLFWDEICKLGTTDSGLMESDPAKAGRILELLAQYEPPGYEVVLNELLQRWFRYDDYVQGREDYTTIDWAVDRSQVPTLWWLLSKGGYSSNTAVARALRLVPGEYPPSDVRHYIKKLLRQPPPILDTVANPNTDRITPAPALVDETNPSLQMQGNIVDMYSNGETVNIPYTRASIRDIIYDKGPESLMTEAKEDLSHRDLNALKATLRQNINDRNMNDHGPSRGISDPQHPRTAHFADFESHDTDAGDERSNRITSNLNFRWIHLPVTELQLMRDLVCRLSHDSSRLELDHSSLMKHFNRSWTEIAAGGERNYMKPQCVRMQILPTSRSSEEEIACTALYMPYLVPGIYKKPNTTRNGHEPDGPLLEESIDSRNSRKVLHKPMTLDQFYYPTIADTDERDNDQVVSRYLQQKHDEKEKARLQQQYGQGKRELPPRPSTSRGEKKILMVNNLWVWIIGQKTIITATAEGTDQRSKSNLLQATLNNILYGGSRSRFERATTVESVMELILGVAVGSFVEKSISVGLSMKGPIEIFRESIRDGANEESLLFNGFLAGLNQEAKEPSIIQSQESWLTSSKGGQVARNRYHVISTETELLYRTRDIYDELHMLRSLADDQDAVWQQAFFSKGAEGSFQHYHSCTPADVKKDLDDMLSGTEQTTNNINTLLDLRQAEYSRIQANGSAALSNTILVFTIVTIVFLPLSFLSSLFALDVSSFPHIGDNLRYDASWIFPIIFGVTAIFSAPAIILAWNVNIISRWFQLSRSAHNNQAGAGAGAGATPNATSDVLAQQRDVGRGFRRRFGGLVRRGTLRDERLPQ